MTVSLALAFFVGVLGSGTYTVAAQPRWTEADVVRLVGARSPEVQIAAAERELAAARVEGAGLPENPSLGFQREQGLGAGAQVHDVLALRVPIDLSGRRAARRALLRAEAGDVELQAVMVRRAALGDALDAFDELLGAGRRVAIAANTDATLSEALRVITSREQAGAVSGYEQSRLALAAELARSALEEARANEGIARVRLAASVDPSEAEATAVGELSTSAPASLEEARALGRRRRPELAAVRHLVSAGRDAESAASLAWIPGVTLTGGWNAERGERTENGFVAGIELGLPIFSHGQDLRAEGAAASRTARARADAISARIDTEVRIAHARLTAARVELSRFEAAVTPHLETLARSAAAGYREGARSLVELVDAQQALADVESRRLDLALAAAHAETALRLATGEIR